MLQFSLRTAILSSYGELPPYLSKFNSALVVMQSGARHKSQKNLWKLQSNRSVNITAWQTSKTSVENILDVN
jgi:hypothetical protein